MFTLSVKNIFGEILDLSKSDEYEIIKIDGLSPPAINLNMETMAGYDGKTYYGSYIDTRNIIITVCLLGDIESSRNKLYKYFELKNVTRIYYSNGIHNVYIDAYLESLESDLFVMSQKVQISMICPQPYFIAENQYELTHTETQKLFEFPFEIPVTSGVEFAVVNPGYIANITGGNVNSGIIFDITANTDFGSVLDRKIVTIKNETTGKLMQFHFYLSQNEKIYINTFVGSKQIRILRNNKWITAMADFISGEWLDIQRGINTIRITDNSGIDNALSIQAYAFEWYGGV